MKTEQYILTDGLLQENLGAQANLVLLFGATKRIKEKGLIDMIQAAYPNACIFGCSTAGEIIGTQVLDDSLIVTAVSFSATKVAGVMISRRSFCLSIPEIRVHFLDDLVVWFVSSVTYFMRLFFRKQPRLVIVEITEMISY